MNLVDASWPIERAGEALAALAARSGLMAAPRELPAPGATLLADPDDGAIDRWFAGAAATLGLEAEAIDSDLGGVDDLLRRSPPSLLRVGADGRRLLLVLRGGRRALEVLPPDLRPRRVALAAVRGELCEPVLAPARAAAASLVARTGLVGARAGRAVDLLLRRRLAALRVGRAWLLRPSPAAPLRQLLRADGLVPRLVALVGLRALELGLSIGSWWLIGGLVFAGRSDPGWAWAWVLLLLTIVPCRMGQAAIVGEVLRGAGVILKRRLLVGAMAMDGDLTRREGAGLLLGRVLETSAVEALGLRGGLLALFAILEFVAAVPLLATGPAGGLHLALLAAWTLVAAGLVRRAGLDLRAWTDERATLTHHLIEVMVGHRTRLAQEPPARWHEREDVRLRGVLAAEGRLSRSEALLVALVPRGWLALGVATGVSYAGTTAERVMPWLDEQAAAWRRARTDACLNNSVRDLWSDDLLGRAQWCLEDRQMELESLVTELGRANATVVQKAVSVAARLRPVDTCMDEGLLLRQPAPPTHGRDAVRELRAEISRAQSIGLGGDFNAALIVATRARERAQQVLDWPPLLAAARMREGNLLERTGAYEQAEIASTDANLGSVALAAGEPQDALPLLARAVSIVDTTDSVESFEPEARFDLARALVATRGDQARALAEATRARDGYRQAGASKAGELAEVEQWLAGREVED